MLLIIASEGISHHTCNAVICKVVCVWSTLIGRDCRDTVLSLVELDYAKVCCYGMISGFQRIYYRLTYAIKNHRKARNNPHVGGYFVPKATSWSRTWSRIQSEVWESERIKLTTEVMVADGHLSNWSWEFVLPWVGCVYQHITPLRGRPNTL